MKNTFEFYITYIGDAKKQDVLNYKYNIYET